VQQDIREISWKTGAVTQNGLSMHNNNVVATSLTAI